MADPILTLQAAGLVSTPNDLAAPEGSLLEGENIAIDRDSIITPVRGFERMTYPLPGSGKAVAMTFWNGSLVVMYNTGGATDTLCYYDEDGTDSATMWPTLGTGYEPPSEGRAYRFREMGESLYWTTIEGIYKLESLNADPVKAGGLKGMNGTATLTGASGFFLNNTQRAYRILWIYEDASGRLIRGVPSQRIVLTNSAGGTRNVSLTFKIPDGVNTLFAFQIYRSLGSAGVSDPPDDNLYLAYENNPTELELTAGTITVVDIQTDDLLGEGLYTNPNVSANGIADGNEPPPLAQDISSYKGMGLYANVLGLQRLEIALVGEPGVSTYIEFDNGDRWSMAYFASESVDDANKEGFYINAFDVAGGTTATDIADTAQSFCRVINMFTTFPLRAYYVSTDQGLPGRILLEAKELDCPRFYVFTDMNNTNWLPALPIVATPGTSQQRVGTTVSQDISAMTVPFVVGDTVTVKVWDQGAAPFSRIPHPDFPEGQKVLITAGGGAFDVEWTEAGAQPTTSVPTRYFLYKVPYDTVASKADRYKNGLYVSKLDEYAAVPLGQVFFAGDDSEEIERVLPLRDAFFLLKTDGIFRGTGSAPEDIDIDELDTSIKLIAPNTALVTQNQIVGLFDQGVMIVNDSGASPISRAIETELNEHLASLSTATIYEKAFAVADEDDKKYLLFLPEDDSDTCCTFAYVYNFATRTWVKRIKSARCGTMRPSNRNIYLGANDSGHILAERRTFTFRDFADESLDVPGLEVLAVGDDLDTLTANLFDFDPGTFNVGDVVYVAPDDSTWRTIDSFARILELDETSGSITLDRPLEDLEPGLNMIRVLKGIAVTVRWIPQHAGSPAVVKQFTEAQLHFARMTQPTVTMAFATELSPGFEEVDLEMESQETQWGQSEWGNSPWGEATEANEIGTLTIPDGKQRGALLHVRLTFIAGWSWCELQATAILGRAYQAQRTRK